MSAIAQAVPRATALVDELAKLPAFLRRDLLVAWSYRLSFASDWLSLAVQAVMFSFVGKLVDPSHLPSYGGTHASYMEFVAIGIAVSAFVQLALLRVASGIRGEQMMGTLESLLMTPTSPVTVQLGTVGYELLYVPIRTAVFLGLAAAAFGLHFDASAVVPAALVLLAFIPFVWGLGVVNAGFVLTFRRGTGVTGFGITLLTLFSGAYFPLDLLPGWATTLAELNPVAIAVDAMRQQLLGDAGWADAGLAVALLAPASLISLLVGIAVFRLALRRERRRGSLGLY